jgi:AraC-like DNA-binding protein
MAKQDQSMCKTDMETGDAITRGVQKRLQQCGVQVLHSLRVPITPTGWATSFLSPFWRIYRMTKSGAWIEFEGKRIPLEPGRLYVIPAWVAFSTGTAHERMQDYVHFDVEGFPAAVLRAAFSRPLVLAEAGVLRGLSDEWSAVLGDDAEAARSWLCHVWAGALVQAVLAVAVKASEVDKLAGLEQWLAQEPTVQPAMDMIELRLATPPSNAELAAACGLSADHFIRRFRVGTGLTPAQYGLERRVLASARLLAETDRKIEDIAEAAGFNDRFYFTRMFKARLAVTPAAYRRIHRLERIRGVG